MHVILQSVVGGPGPLIVEYMGDVFIENCFIITDKHVSNISKRLKDIKFTKIEQTSDRSFVFT